MEQQEIIELNKKVALFCGLNVTEFQWGKDHSVHLVFCDEQGEYDMRYLDYYDPHLNWNQTMPAFFKFRDLEFEDANLGNRHAHFLMNIMEEIYECEDGTPLSALKELAKGIEWVNEIKK